MACPPPHPTPPHPTPPHPTPPHPTPPPPTPPHPTPPHPTPPHPTPPHPTPPHPTSPHPTPPHPTPPHPTPTQPHPTPPAPPRRSTSMYQSTPGAQGMGCAPTSETPRGCSARRMPPKTPPSRSRKSTSSTSPSLMAASLRTRLCTGWRRTAASGCCGGRSCTSTAGEGTGAQVRVKSRGAGQKRL
jgi:hypothetical protein